MIKHLQINVTGRVQGVFFRHFTQKTARQLQLSGFVRNDPDSSVYIEIEGKEQSLEKFLQWCRKGPKWAKVERVDLREDKVKNFIDFKIL